MTDYWLLWQEVLTRSPLISMMLTFYFLNILQTITHKTSTLCLRIDRMNRGPAETSTQRTDSNMNVLHCPHLASSHWVLATVPSCSINHIQSTTKPNRCHTVFFLFFTHSLSVLMLHSVVSPSIFPSFFVAEGHGITYKCKV